MSILLLPGILQQSRNSGGTGLKDNLIACYEGITVNDSFGSNDGTNYGVSLNQSGAKINKCYDFEVSEGDYIRLPNTNFDFEYTDPFSISVWVKLESSAASQFIIGKMSGWDVLNGWGLWLESSNNLTFGIINTFWSNKAYIVSNETVSDSVWAHIIATYDGSGDTSGMETYINGTVTTHSVDTNDLNSNSIQNSINTNIGAINDGDFSFDGLMEQVAIFAEVLDVTKRGLLNNSGNGLAYSAW